MDFSFFLLVCCAFHLSKSQTVFLSGQLNKLYQSLQNSRPLVLLRLRGFRAAITQRSCFHPLAFHASILPSVQGAVACCAHHHHHHQHHHHHPSSPCVFDVRNLGGAPPRGWVAVCGAETTPVLCCHLAISYLLVSPPRFYLIPLLQKHASLVRVSSALSLRQTCSFSGWCAMD